MGKTIAVSNMKGGCGKSFTASSLGIGLARQGQRVLLIDADSQHSLTVSHGIMEPDRLSVTLASVIADIISDKELEPTAGIIRNAEGVDLLPASFALVNIELSMVAVMGRETILKQYVETVRPLYDWIIIDTSPSMGLLTVNALAAADSVLIPVTPKYLDTKGLELLLRTIAQLRRHINPNPVIPSAGSLKWIDVFKKVSISSDDDIPINKRGSGVKRLILLNFFRAEAERKRVERNSASIIYAIEEPETSQHTEHQKRMIQAFLALAEVPNTQIIITTHSAALVKELAFENLRLITVEDTLKTVTPVVPSQLPNPSLSEVNYSAFAEVSEEYHYELYGYIEVGCDLNAFKSGKPTISYTRIQRDGTTKNEQIVLTEYIRHQIHHPENTHNARYTPEQLKESICLMRDYIGSISP